MINSIKIVIMAVIGLIITIPFFREEKEGSAIFIHGGKRDHLLSEKEALYSTIKELDFDHETGKLSDEDYKQLKNEYTEKALGILKALDHVDDKSGQDKTPILHRKVEAVGTE